MSTSAPSREDRAALARAVLARAELRTGARSAHAAASVEVSVGMSSDAVLPVDRPAVGHPVLEHPAVEHPALALVGPAPQQRSTTSLLTTERPPMAVPPPLLPLLPGGLRRGATTVVTGSTSLVLTMLAHACSGGAWAAVVGQPTVGLLAAAQAGVALDRLAVVPRPGARVADVMAALVDGMDVVVVGPEAALTDADRRRLSARARDRGGVLLATVEWPGASTVLTVEAGRWTGAGAGDGRLRTHELRVTRSGRGASAAPRSVDLTLPLGGAAPDGVPAGAAPDTLATDGRAQGGPGPDLRLVG